MSRLAKAFQNSFAGILASVLMAVMFVGSADAAEPISVRAGQHDAFARIVVDLPRPIGYVAKLNDDQLILEFDEPVTGDVSQVGKTLAEHVRRAALIDETRLVLDLKGPHRMKDFVNEGSIVVDLRPVTENAPKTQRINTRFGDHPTFTRLVFDWPSTVGYRLRNQDGSISIRFDRAADIRVSPSVLEYATGFEDIESRITGSDTEVDMKVSGRIRHFRDGFKVVVDVFDAPGKKVASKPTKAERPKEADKKITKAAPEPPAPVVAPAEIASAALQGPVSLAPPAVHDNHATNPGAAVTLASASSGPLNLLPASMTPAPRNPDALPADAASLEVEVIAELDGALLRFPFAQKTAAAIFRRGGYLWIAFDSLARLNTAQIASEAGDFVTEIEQLPHESATVLRLATIPGYNALSVRDGTRWEIILAPQLLKPEDAMGVTTIAGNVPSVTVGPTVPGTPLRMVDPGIGDEVRVVPVFASGEGVAQRHLFPDFRLLTSIQGVVVIPLSDRLNMRSSHDRVIISATGGLRLTDSSARNRVLASGGSDELERMFRFKEWRHAELGDLQAAGSELLAQIRAMEPAARDNGRLALARFYLAHGLADRTLGVLRVISANMPEMERVPSFKATRGAASFLIGDTAGAERDLFDRELDAEPEIELWRAAVRAAQGDIVSASIELQTAERFVQDYPDSLRVHFAFLGTEIALASGDPVAGEFWLEVIGDAELTPSEMDRRRVFLAEIAGRNGEIDTAISLYDQTIAGHDRRSRAIATLAKAELLLSEEDISPAEAVNELNGLRYVWRGDGLEFKILRRLGELEIASGRYRDGLRTLKRAAANFPEHPDTPRLTDDMRAAFVSLYLDGRADEMEPVSAIALFDEFRELAPAGSTGDAMIRRLADRLVAVDLLDKAAELLTHQVEFRLEGLEKASVGADLAMIQILNRKPELALEALEKSKTEDMLPATRRDRALARSRALKLVGNYNQALAALGRVDGDEADLLRAEIHWKAQDWDNAANVFARLGGPIPEGDSKLTDQRSRYVLNRAIALALGKNSTRLGGLARAFGPAMAETPYAADFKAMTSVDTSPRDFTDVLERVALVDDFQAFMDSYRARLSSNATTAG